MPLPLARLARPGDTPNEWPAPSPEALHSYRLAKLLHLGRIATAKRQSEEFAAKEASRIAKLESSRAWRVRKRKAKADALWEQKKKTKAEEAVKKQEDMEKANANNPRKLSYTPTAIRLRAKRAGIFVPKTKEEISAILKKEASARVKKSWATRRVKP